MPTVTAAGSPLSVALREGSSAEHRQAEGSRFMSRLLSDGVAPGEYAAYLGRLVAVYEHLETLVRRHASHPHLAGFHDPALERTAALRADLAHWHGSEVASPAVTAYVERLSTAAAEPTLLVAHHYTRYLGDLAGGQALGRLLRRRGDGGLAFYSFARIESPKRYRDGYRARLDALALGPALHERVVAEVRGAFRLTLALLEEL